MKPLTHSRLPKPAKKAARKAAARRYTPERHEPEAWEVTAQANAAAHRRTVSGWHDDLLIAAARDILRPGIQYDTAAERRWMRDRRAAVALELDRRHLLPLSLTPTPQNHAEP
jgi:hypothetical protein